MKPGILLHKHSADFAVHSNAQAMTLLLFDSPDAESPAREVPMERKQNLWHVPVPDIKHGQLYLYATETGQRLLDPCARALHTQRAWGERGIEDRERKTEDGKRNIDNTFPKCVVVDDSFDWGEDKPPNTPLENTIIYEAHLRGFTKNEDGGSYLDFIEKIPYLKELGITAVEFLPLFEFNELEFFLRGDSRKNLLNLWGYSTLGFFAPMSRFAASPEPGAAVSEFKTLVKALHAAGIEVILDVVFNHTGEGEKNDPTYHFRELDEEAYYLMDPDGSYQNWTGCGNTVNANHPVTKQFIVDSLKTWVTEMHVDGFRFDLATSLCRGRAGKLLEKPPVIQAIEADPALKHTKLIAEAWDLGAYQVGHYPGKRFCDWNGKYRDDVRRFWNHSEPVADLATRLAGSEDLYGHKNSGPLHSINFITSHDGFTLADLVSYKHKHNEANREENRDGEQHNESASFGIEGPTEDPAINARRLLQQKNLLATLFLSQGVPMLTAGDEFGRTQQGNNNAYCQDNDISWVDWSLLEKNRELFEFTKKLIALRKAHPSLRRKTHFTGKGDVEWIEPDGGEPDWEHGRALGMHLVGPDRRAGRGRLGEPSLPQDDLLILINNEDHAIDFSNGWTRCGAREASPRSSEAMTEGNGNQAEPAPKNTSKHWKKEISTTEVEGFTLPPHSLAVYSAQK